MERLDAVEELEAQVRRRMADVTFTIDPPGTAAGSWWMDVQRYGRVASIEWRPGIGYGVAAPDGGYGEGIDFLVNDASAAAEFVARVLQHSGAEPRPSVTKSELRQQLIVALSEHIDRVLDDVVHSTIERILAELREQASEVTDIRRVEDELSRIAKKVLSERHSLTSKLTDNGNGDNESASAKRD